MKAFWASVILFGVMLFCIAGNAAYIHGCTNEIHTLVSELDDPSGRQVTLARLDELWKKQQRILTLSVGYEKINRLTEMLDCLWWAHSVKDEAEFELYRILLTDAIDEIERADILSGENLF